MILPAPHPRISTVITALEKGEEGTRSAWRALFATFYSALRLLERVCYKTEHRSV